MKKIAFVVQSHSRNNKVFDLSDPILNRDNCHYQFFLLKQYFERLGYDLSTDDINDPSSSDAVLYRNLPPPDRMPGPDAAGKSFLFFLESQAVRPWNYDREAHKNFARIFTNADEFIDGNRYIKVNYCSPFPGSLTENLAPRSDFATLIAANKRTPHPDSLASRRRALIDWFDAHHPDKLDLFGPDWDLYRFSGPRLVRRLNRVRQLRPLRRVLARTPRIYKGTVESKEATLRKYKFSITYENVGGVKGYITEKIHDSLKAGCIPVYLGAPNIGDYVPEDCFIDVRKFPSFESLYDFMSSIGDEEYSAYVRRMDRYLRSDACRQFTPEHFAETISKGIVDMLENGK